MEPSTNQKKAIKPLPERTKTKKRSNEMKQLM